MPAANLAGGCRKDNRRCRRRFYTNMEQFTLDERRQHILQLQNPKWEIVLQEYNRMLGDHRLSETEIAGLFGGKYKDRRSFKQSTSYRNMVLGLVRLWLLTQ